MLIVKSPNDISEMYKYNYVTWQRHYVIQYVTWQRHHVIQYVTSDTEIVIYCTVIIFWQCWPCTLGNFLLLEYNKIIQSNQNFINNSYMKCFSLFFDQVSLNAVTPWSHIPSHRAEHLHSLIITLHDYYIPLSYVQCIASPVVTMGV